eukprot:scaffold718_cov342-Pavlova_lutheri.AAC.27
MGPMVLLFFVKNAHPFLRIRSRSARNGRHGSSSCLASCSRLASSRDKFRSSAPGRNWTVASSCLGLAPGTLGWAMHRSSLVIVLPAEHLPSVFGFFARLAHACTCFSLGTWVRMVLRTHVGRDRLDAFGPSRLEGGGSFAEGFLVWGGSTSLRTSGPSFSPCSPRFRSHLLHEAPVEPFPFLVRVPCDVAVVRTWQDDGTTEHDECDAVSGSFLQHDVHAHAQHDSADGHQCDGQGHGLSWRPVPSHHLLRRLFEPHVARHRLVRARPSHRLFPLSLSLSLSLPPNPDPVPSWGRGPTTLPRRSDSP